MDGTRDRPAGKPAENRSRRDGIRAGAVSGPWRSGPPDEMAAPERRAPPERRPVVEPEPLPVEPARRSPSVALWTVAGFLVAFAFVAAAFLLRPEPSAPAPEAVATSTPLPEEAPAEPARSAAVPTPAPALDPAAFAAVSTVRLRIAQDLPQERREAIRAALAAAGLGSVRVEPQPFAIATSRVGYYRPEDLAAAEALGQLVAPVMGGEIGVRDYGQLLPDAEPGRLDLWIAG